MLVRQLILFGGFLLVAVLLIFVVRSCQASAKENALKDYNRQVASIVRDSDEQVGQNFFQIMRNPDSASASDLSTEINSYRTQAQQQYDQAKRLDVPDEMTAAQRSFLITMEARRDGLTTIAAKVRDALSDNREAADAAIAQITGAMQLFLTSDVLYKWRTEQFIRAELEAADVGGQTIQQTRFLPGVEWLDDGTVRDALGQQLSGDDRGGAKREPAPGLHGTSLESVSVGDVTLAPGAANRIPAAEPEFTVKFSNQGEHDETDVKVVLRIAGDGDPIRVEHTVPAVAQGATAEASLTLDKAPPTSDVARITVEVEAVPGEEKTDNNKQEYEALFVK